ncbi:MAG TPA: hypothetical protein VF339_04110 [Gammaproteobacteria bacterium]
MAKVSLAEKIALFEDPRTFPDRPERVESIETHFAWIFLSPRFVYKLKKPIRFGAIDFRNPEARRAYCELEVTLNRRLAADTYLRVVSVVAAAEGLRLDGDGELVDAVVEMRRLPDGASLADVDRAIGDAELNGIVRRLVAFYARTPVAPWDGPRYVEALARFSLQHLALVDGADALTAEHGISRDVLERVVAAQLDFVERHRSALERRAVDGRIVDAHGDLRAEHVFLTEPLQIIDCLEFSIGLRWLDTAEEVAFLALDCDRRGIGDVAERLLAAYREHAADPVPAPLLEFYRSRRALARAVLAARRVPEAVADADVWRARARWYLDAASASIAAASGG